MSDGRISGKPVPAPVDGGCVAPKVEKDAKAAPPRIQRAEDPAGRLAPVAYGHPACVSFLNKQAKWERQPDAGNISALVGSLADLIADREVPRATRRAFAAHLCEILGPLEREQRPSIDAMHDLFARAIPVAEVLEGVAFPAWERNFSAAIVAGNSQVLQQLIGLKSAESSNGDGGWLDTIAAGLDQAQCECAPALFSECMDVVCGLITQPEDLARAVQAPSGQRPPLGERDRHCFATYCEKIAHSKILSAPRKGDLLACGRVLHTGGFYFPGPRNSLVILSGLQGILRGAGQEKRDLAGLRWKDACLIAERYLGGLSVNGLVDELFIKVNGECLEWAPSAARRPVEFAAVANLPGAAKAAKRLEEKPADSKCVVS